MLTREQIETRKRLFAKSADEDGAALCDLALAALELREWVPQGWQLVAIERPEGYEDVHHELLMHDALRDGFGYALPLTPDGADQRGEAATEKTVLAGSFTEEAVGAPQSSPHPLPADLLDDLIEYFDGRADVVDGSYGEPHANREMQILQRLKELPAEQVPATPFLHSGDSGAATPARAGEPRCWSEPGEWCGLCGWTAPIEGCIKGRTQA